MFLRGAEYEARLLAAARLCRRRTSDGVSKPRERGRRQRAGRGSLGGRRVRTTATAPATQLAIERRGRESSQRAGRRYQNPNSTSQLYQLTEPIRLGPQKLQSGSGHEPMQLNRTTHRIPLELSI